MDALVTPEQLASYLQRDQLDRSTVELALAAASGVVRDYCRWHISPGQTEALTLDGTGNDMLVLPTLFVTGVASVAIDGTALELATGPYPSVRGYSWSANGLLRCSNGWPKRYRCIDVTLTHGFPTTPDGVAMVVFAVAARAVSNPQGLKHRQVGQVIDAYAAPEATSLGPIECRVLDGYRLR